MKAENKTQKREFIVCIHGTKDKGSKKVIFLFLILGQSLPGHSNVNPCMLFKPVFTMIVGVCGPWSGFTHSCSENSKTWGPAYELPFCTSTSLSIPQCLLPNFLVTFRTPVNSWIWPYIFENDVHDLFQRVDHHICFSLNSEMNKTVNHCLPSLYLGD